MVACRFEQKEAIALLLEQGALSFFVDNIIYKDKKSFDFKNDQKAYVEIMIQHYVNISDVVPENYMNTINLLQRMKIFYKPAIFKDRIDNIEEHIVDGLEEIIEQCVESITGAN